jgi:putative glutamine amidotransferase
MSGSLPLIGVLCRHDRSVNYRKKPVYAQGEAYMSAVSQAGGIPFLIPLNLPLLSRRRLYDLADGILLAGGGDIDPALFNQASHPTQGDVQPDRDAEEIAVSRWAAAEGKPLLAICRGIQVVAVAAGGTLWQDLPSQMPEAACHRHNYHDGDRYPDDYLAHAVELSPSSRLARIVRTDTIWTNSFHHQAVQSVPEPWQIVGHSSDGVIEAIELPEHPFFCGVQWHPEVLVAGHESARQIFQAFVRACQV